TSPNTCGWRRTSFSWIRRATRSRSPSPCSRRRSARKYTWNSRSPSSSSSFAGSSASAASATSYATSTVCGTIVRGVCSRSHGQSRRSRSVSSWRSRRAAARPDTSARGRRRRGRRRRRREPGGVADLPVVLLLQALEPLLQRLALLLLQQLLADRRLDLGERRRLALRRVLLGADDVPAELRLDRFRDRPGLERERRLVELGDGLATRDRQLPALRLRARILRVALRQGAEVRAVLQLVVQPIGQRLRLDEDVADDARRGLRVDRLVRVVVGLHLRVRHLRVRGHLLVDLVGEHLGADVRAHLGVGHALPLQLRPIPLLAPAEVLLLELLQLRLDLRVADLDSQVRRLLRQLGPLDEPLQDLLLDRQVLLGAGLREGALLQVVAALRLRDPAVERLARDVLVADDRSVGLRDLAAALAAAAATAASAGGCEQRQRGEN